MAKSVKFARSKRAAANKVIGIKNPKKKAELSETSSDDDEDDNYDDPSGSSTWEFVDDTIEWYYGPGDGETYIGPYGKTWHLGVGWWWRYRSCDWRWT